MRAGGSKQKGNSFERKVCTMLSLWASKADSRDLYWRSASSGARATQLDKTREERVGVGQGDIVGFDDWSNYLLDVFTVECKTYKSVGLSEACFGMPRMFGDFWTQAKRSCVGTEPFLILKENRRNELVFTTRKGLDLLNKCARREIKRTCSFPKFGAHGILLAHVISLVVYAKLAAAGKAAKTKRIAERAAKKKEPK